jgi:predicted AlkP superfamily phosphohydrolase/phosphomutase
METVLIGVDGLEPSLVEQWRDDLPTFRRLMDEGSFGRLRSSDPPISFPAWQWLYTGKQGGKHNVFGFTHRKEGSYERTSANLSNVMAETLWDALSFEGRSVGVVNVPGTYPPADVDDGFMISGWPVPNRTRPANPESVLDEIEAEIGESYTVNPIPMGPELFDFDADQVYESLSDAMDHHRRAFEALVDLYRNDLDVFFCVFRETDTAGHHLAWDEEHLKRLYVDQDAALASLLETVPDDANVVLFSDHGHVAKSTLNFHVTEWLRENDYLAVDESSRPGLSWFGRNVVTRLGITRKNLLRAKNKLGIDDVRAYLPQSVFDLVMRLVPPTDQHLVMPDSGLDADDVDWSETTAYTGPEANVVFLNTSDAHPEGTVDDPEPVRQQLKDKLLDIEHPDPDRGGLVTDIKTKDEVFSGPYAENAPAIVFIADEMRCQVHPGTNDGEVFSETRLGEHRPDGVLITSGPAFDDAESVSDRSILDVFPLVLSLLDASIPADVDGEIPADRLTSDPDPTYRESRDEHGSVESYSDAEDEAIREQLKGLGYLDG